MRYLKVVGQGTESNLAIGNKYNAGFFEAGNSEAVYESQLGFYRIQKLKVSDSIDPSLIAKLDQFMSSRATRDLVRMFDRSFRGDSTGKVMELVAEGHTEDAGATAVMFRFFNPDGELSQELHFTPETEEEKKRSEAILIDIFGPSIDVRGKKKRRKENRRKPRPVPQTAAGPAMTDDNIYFVSELCKAYLATGW
ncbi:hypothetical protein [Pseudomonas fluorescens]|uniref:hypothetical protein n=1 Tax=Pseudomonas fluorescens TaxID=294 RepID=UPI00054C30DF|nr:hypothetical protein [Pseudomonas fluorescens]KII35810.1 hypothetical protein RY26_10300 [Pseudomonas fluorescens]